MRAAHDPNTHEPRPPKWGRRFGSVIGLGLLAYLATGVYYVRTDEHAVVQRCGKVLDRVRTPDLYVGLPYGIDKVTRLKVHEVKRVGVNVDLSERPLGRRTDPGSAECLTGDRNLILVAAVVQYQIKDAKAYVLRTADVAALVRNAAAASLASVVSGTPVDDVLTVQRLAIRNRVRAETQAALDSWGVGVHMLEVSLEGVAPPQEVAEAFRDVTAAREDRQRAINEANGYKSRLLPQSRGEAQRILTEADAEAAKTRQESEGEAERFRRMAAQLPNSPGVTIRRLILETLEQVLPRVNKVVVDSRARDTLDLGLIEDKE